MTTRPNQYREDQSDRPELDYSKIDFPSDELTVHQIRLLEPSLNTNRPTFAWTGEEGVPSIEGVLSLEREVAAMAFEIARGHGRRISELERDYRPKDLDNDLVAAYMTYNMAATTHEAGQLIRTIKEQAREQAKGTQGRRPDETGPRR